jgi:3-oxoacyl-[acyl-carrier protein] reductase
MKKQHWGRVVTIASLQGREGGGRPWYNMAKSAEISLMKTLAMDPDLSGAGITFNSVAPGAVIFPGNEWDRFRRQEPDKFRERINKKNPCGRLGTPEDIASVVVFLCSEKAGLINGTSIAVDGAEGRSF